MTSQMNTQQGKKLKSWLIAILLASVIILIALFWLSKGSWKSPFLSSIVTKSKSPQTWNYTNSDFQNESGVIAEGVTVVALPDWIEGYKIWHKRQRRKYDREKATDVKFLVVVCLKRTQCGGLSDRVRSIPYWLVQAEKTERVLLIHWNKKYQLEDFWVPPEDNQDYALDWRLERWVTRPPFSDSCLQKPTKVLHEHHDESNHEYMMGALQSSERVVCVTTRADLTPKVYDLFGTTERTSQIVVSNVFGFMFTPTEALQEYIDRIKEEQIGLNANEEYLATHIRALYPLRSESALIWPTWEEHSELMKKWAYKAVESVIAAYQTHYNSDAGGLSLPPIYVASDSANVVDYMLSGGNNNSWPTRILGLKKSLPRNHLDLDTFNNSADDMFPAFFDIAMLSHAKCLSYGIGSYGRLGARMSAGLECVTRHRQSIYFEEYNSGPKNVSAEEGKQGPTMRRHFRR
ncbi:unnamed protein product [Cylindrotheca closterium]|uniref:Uncharacterized protein n=1 Tax=Cylindrotheca closterium TaxID=2856 RepID=A0AAD2CJ62_9STRA|nr:unnamed protein product [Cylindrotheca closterium]